MSPHSNTSRDKDSVSPASASGTTPSPTARLREAQSLFDPRLIMHNPAWAAAAAAAAAANDIFRTKLMNPEGQVKQEEDRDEMVKREEEVDSIKAETDDEENEEVKVEDDWVTKQL